MHREKYETYTDSKYDWLHRKVHHDLDRFLMEHRETMIIIATEALERELKQMHSEKAPKTRTSWWRRVTTKTVRP